MVAMAVQLIQVFNVTQLIKQRIYLLLHTIKIVWMQFQNRIFILSIISSSRDILLKKDIYNHPYEHTDTAIGVTASSIRRH